MKRRVLVSAALFAAFFALYALTAQRGLGWGDSGGFHYRVLFCPDGILGGCEAFATAHPLYVALAKAVCRTPYSVTLVSSFFGALAVAGLFLLTRRVALAVVFGFAHMLWWLSCVAEVQTMNLAITVFETAAFLRFVATRRSGWLALAAFLAGVHLNVHNFALLALPVYAVAAFRPFRLKRNLIALALWACGASWWLWAVVTFGPGQVLVGRWGSQVAGALPADWMTTAFNLCLAGLSFFAPLAILHWHRRDVKTGLAKPAPRPSGWVVSLFAIHALFFVRYFVPDQATFLLPTLFFAYLLVADLPLRANRATALALMEVVLPLVAAHVLALLPVPAERAARHPGRDEARYFALPWKCQDDSADRCAAARGGVWMGGD